MSKTLKVVRYPNGETYLYGAHFADAVTNGRAELLTGHEAKEAHEAWLRSEILDHVKPGETVLTTVCTHYSPSSGTARYKVLLPIIGKDGKPYIQNITNTVALLCGFKLSKDHEIVMGGSGYSKSFQIGYSLGLKLWPNGTPEAHSTRNGQPDRCGGYALSCNGL